VRTALTASEGIGIKTLTAAVPKGLLARQSEPCDPEIAEMLECVSRLKGSKGS
jgi:hypothetical protein